MNRTIMDRSQQRQNLQFIIPLLVSAVLFMEFLDTSIINTAVPSIAISFGISPLLLKFSVASYFLSLAIFIPISGWCADKFGSYKVFLFSVALFTFSSLLCGISQNATQLTTFRFLQGIGGAFMNPVARIVVLRLFPAKDLVRMQGYIFTPAMLGYVLGPFLGGVISTYLTWHWIFLINIPAGLLILYFGSKYIINYCEPNTPNLDWGGFMIAAMSLCAVTVFVETLNHYDILSKKFVVCFGVVGVLLFIILVLYSSKKAFPILDFSLLQIKTFKIGFYINLLQYAVSSSIAFLMPLMFQSNFGESPAKSGLLILPLAIAYLLFRAVTGKCITKFGFRNVLLVNIMALFLFILMLTQIRQSTPDYMIYTIMFLIGISSIMIGASTGALNYVKTPKILTSRVTSLDLTFRQFSQSMGIGLSSFMLSFFSKLLGVNITTIGADVFHYTFMGLSGLVIISFVFATRLHKSDYDEIT